MTPNYTRIEAKTQADYDAIAESFAHSRRDLHWPELDQIISQVQAGAKVLDIGCGTGRLAKFLASKQVDFTGIDISAQQLEQARQLCPEAKFVQASMLELPFPEASFDTVFMIASLHHLHTIAERQKAVQEALRVLKPGGKLYITVMNLWKWRYWPLFFRKAAGKKTFADKMRFNDIFLPWTKQKDKIIHRYYHAFTKNELQKLIPDAVCGFTDKDKRNLVAVVTKK